MARQIHFEEGNKLFQQKYLIDDSTVTLVGDPVEVVRKPTEYEVKTNGETNPMKEDDRRAQCRRR
jgi:hypothetical protein